MDFGLASFFDLSLKICLGAEIECLNDNGLNWWLHQKTANCGRLNFGWILNVLNLNIIVLLRLDIINAFNIN